MNISIVIPTFNSEQFLRETIESALAQTVPSEIICVNDGSTDGTRFLLDEYADRIKVITQSNRGLPAARNTGIMNAKGDYILPLDSDDILLPTAVDRILNVITDTNADVVAPSFQCFGLSEEIKMLRMRDLGMPSLSIDHFKGGNQIGYCSAIRKSVLLECGGYSPRMFWGYEDYALWFDLLKRNKTIVTIPEILWKYRIRPGSMLSVAQQHHQELMNQIAKDNPGIF